MPQTFSDWVTLIGLLTGFGWLAIEYRKNRLANILAKQEMVSGKTKNAGEEADTMSTYAALVDRAAKKEVEYQKIVDTFEGRLAEVEKKATEANLRADRFENWAKRLSGQVYMLGGTPVAFEPGKASGD